MTIDNGFRFAQRDGNILGVVFHCSCCNSLVPFKHIDTSVKGVQRIDCQSCASKGLAVRGVLVACGDDIPGYRIAAVRQPVPAEIKLERVPSVLHRMVPSNDLHRATLGMTG